MTGHDFSGGLPSSPWQTAQACALSSIDWAFASGAAANRTANICRVGKAKRAHRCRGLRVGTLRFAHPTRGGDFICTDPKLLQREGDNVIATLVVDLDIAAGGDNDVLLAVNRIGGRRRVDAGTGVEGPQHLAVLGVIGAETPVAFTREHEAAGGRQYPADHRLRRFHLPTNLAGVVIDGRDVTGLLLSRDDLEGAAEPQLALRIGRAFYMIVHRLMQVDGVGQP